MGANMQGGMQGAQTGASIGSNFEVTVQRMVLLLVLCWGY
ncbi:internal virion protein A [Acinetobacter phage TCUAN2]|nr:internal virion protein A [Acinetobacter phage TCUAN2]